MAYTRSVREIGLDEEPIKSALEALLPDDDEAESTELRWDNVTDDQRRLLLLHPGVREIIGDCEIVELSAMETEA